MKRKARRAAGGKGGKRSRNEKEKENGNGSEKESEMVNRTGRKCDWMQDVKWEGILASFPSWKCK